MKWNGFGNGAIVCIAPLSLIVPDQIMMIMISSEVGTLSARPLLSLCADVAGIVSAVTTVEGPSEFTWWCFTCSVSSGAELEISFGPRGLWLSFRLTRLPTSHKQRKRNNYFLSSSLLVSLCLHLIGWPTQSDDFSGDLRQQTIVFLLAQQRDQSIDQYAKTLAGINGEHNVARQAL